MEQLKEIFRSQGLTVHMHTRRKGLQYVYAAWREGDKVKQKYFGPKSQIEAMTEDQVSQKLIMLKK